MYSELILKPNALADQIIYPDVARSLIAEALDGVNISPLIFNRHGNGKTIVDRYWHDDPNHITAKLAKPPVVSFDGGKGYVRIYMLGKPGRNLMGESAHVIAKAVAKHVGGAYTFSMNEGMCKIEPRNNPVMYYTKRIVVSKSPIKSQRYVKVSPQEVSNDIRRVLLQGLISQARWLDENSDGVCNLEHLIPDEESLGFFIAEGQPAPFLINNQNYAAGYSKLAYSMQLDVSGPWAAGHLRSRGYGQIRKMIMRASHD